MCYDMHGSMPFKNEGLVMFSDIFLQALQLHTLLLLPYLTHPPSHCLLLLLPAAAAATRLAATRWP
jgi:hypothetical protein